MRMSVGVLIVSHTRYEYHYAAVNLAASIKRYNADVHITNLRSKEGEEYLLPSYSFFDDIIYFESNNDYSNPTIAKISMLKYLPYNNTLIIDADTLCLKDIMPLLNKLKEDGRSTIMEIIDSGKYGQEIKYDIWADHDKSFTFFGLDKEKDIWHTTQTSWMFLKRGKEVNKLIKDLLYYYDKKFNYDDLKGKWGKHVPDELYYSGVLSKKSINAKWSSDDVMFFGNKYVDLDIVNKHYFLSLYGQGIGDTTTKLMYWEYYDRVMIDIMRHFNLNHIYKSNYLREAKVSNGR